MKFIDLQSQNKIIRSKVHSSINRIMNNSSYIMGKDVMKLEQELKKINNSKYCITVSSGTDALLIALMALGISKGDEVITTPFTWISTAEVIKLLGAKPIFVDVELETCNMNLDLIASKISKKTKAIIGVSLFGQMYDVKKMSQISKKYKIPVIEDGAQSFGAKYKNISSCNSSLIGCTSFFPTKPLGGYGDGGAIFTNNRRISNICKQIRVHGQKQKNDYRRLGINGRMDSIQCAIVLEKLKIFRKELVLRNNIANYYLSKLKKLSVNDIVSISKTKNHFNVWAQFTIIVKNKKRNDLKKYLSNFKIPTAVYYPKSLDRIKFFQSKYKYKISNLLSGQVLSLPMSPYLKKKDQDFIIKKIFDFYQ